MLPKEQYFTDEELSAFAYSSTITQKAKTMYKETLNGYSENPKGYHPAPRTAKVNIERQAGDATNIVILASHRTDKSAVLSEKKTYTKVGQMGNPNRQFIVVAVGIGEASISFEELMEELAYRPTEIVSISIEHEEGFDELLQLVLKNDSIFNDSPVEIIQAVVVESDEEEPVKSYVFDFAELANRVFSSGTHSIVLEGIGTAKSLEASFQFGVSYAIY